MGYSPPPPDPTRLLVVVDGPNLVNRCGAFLKKHAKATKDVQAKYFQGWFDIDRVVRATLGTGTRLDAWRDLGIVIFHSTNSLGREPYRFASTGKADDVHAFWTRQGTNPNTSTLTVQIPGGVSGRDEKPEDEADGPSEKGVDMSIAVYLFETIDAWDTAVLFSNDTDFVPAVWSLRRRGKRIHCSASPEKKTSPLASACQHFSPLSQEFLMADLSLFDALQVGSALDEFFTMAVKKWSNNPSDATKEIRVRNEISTPTATNDVRDQWRALLAASLESAGFEVGEHGAIDVNVRAPPFGPVLFEGLLRHRETFAAREWHGRVVAAP